MLPCGGWRTVVITLNIMMSPIMQSWISCLSEDLLRSVQASLEKRQAGFLMSRSKGKRGFHMLFEAALPN